MPWTTRPSAVAATAARLNRGTGTSSARTTTGRHGKMCPRAAYKKREAGDVHRAPGHTILADIMHDQFTMPAPARVATRPQPYPQFDPDDRVDVDVVDPATLAAGDALLIAFLAGRSPLTLRAYRRDLEDVRRFLGVPTLAHAAALLLAHGHGPANGLALAYRADLVGRVDQKGKGLAAATINRRLAALRSLVKIARTLGLVPWALEVANVKSQGYRDTRGPGDAGYRRLLGVLDRRRGPAVHRDRAAVRLLFDLALRRAEVVSLDVAHVDLAAGVVRVLGKGQTERVPLTLPEPTRAVLAAWLTVRGPSPGPLFVNFDRARKGMGRRLTGRSLHRIVRALGAEAGLKEVRPHGLRHAAITAALDRTGGDIRAVQRFSRHRDVRVLAVYDDNREDLGGRVARLVARDNDEGE